MTNSTDPDQLTSKKPTDLDLHCLKRQGYPGSVRQGLKYDKTPALPLSLSAANGKLFRTMSMRFCNTDVVVRCYFQRK